MILLRNTQRVLESKGYRQSATPLNIVTNGDFSNGTTGWYGNASVLSVANKIMTFTADGASANPNLTKNPAVSLTLSVGDKIYLSIRARVTNSVSTLIRSAVNGTVSGATVTVTQVTSPTQNGWYSLGGIFTVPAGYAGLMNLFIYQSYSSAAVASGKAMEIDGNYGVQVINITNLPASQQTLAWCDANLPFRTETGTPTYSLVDRSRFANNGTFSNVTWVQLPSGAWVMDFNGTDSYVEIADSPSMRMVEGGTIEAWVYARSLGEGNAGRIIQKGADFDLRIGGTANVIYQINLGTNTFSADNSLPLITWKQICVAFSTSGRKIYINGTDVTNTGGGETALPTNTVSVTRIGNRTSATDRTFDGYIGGLRMHSKVLTQAEVTRNFTAQRSLYGV